MKVPNKNIRRTIIEMISSSNAAHSGSALSLVEILNTVFKNVDLEKIKNNDNDRDRVILSKGHGTAALYAVMYHNGLLDKSLIDTYFKNNTILAGHTSHHVPCVEHFPAILLHDRNFRPCLFLSDFKVLMSTNLSSGRFKQRPTTVMGNQLALALRENFGCSVLDTPCMRSMSP